MATMGIAPIKFFMIFTQKRSTNSERLQIEQNAIQKRTVLAYILFRSLSQIQTQQLFLKGKQHGKTIPLPVQNRVFVETKHTRFDMCFINHF